MNTRPTNYPLKLHRVFGDKQVRPSEEKKLGKTFARVQESNHLISIHSKSIRWVTIMVIFSALEQPTTTQLCMYVSLDLGFSFKLTFFLKGEAEHKEVKKLYGRTNKRKNFVSQVTVHYRRKQVLAKIASSAKAHFKMAGTRSPGRSKDVTQQRQTSPCIPIEDRDALPFMRPHEHHLISSSEKDHENIIRFAHRNPRDSATQVIHHATLI
jgi:hypothetical protein